MTPGYWTNRDAQLQRDAVPDRRDPGLHPLVRGLPVELPAPRPVGTSWRMDETYIKVKGIWKYLYRAVDKQGKTVDFC